MNPRTANLIQLNLAVIIWGGTAMFAKGVALPVTHIIGYRSLVAAGGILAWLIVLKARIRVHRPQHYGIMLILGLLLCAHWLTYFKALKVSTAAVAILALHTYPVFTALVEPVVFREKLKAFDVALACIVLAGIAIMTPQISLSNTTTQGIALGIISGLFFMARNLMTRKYVKHYTGSTLIFWQTLVTGIALLPVIFLADAQPYPPRTISLLILLGIVFTAVPQVLFTMSFQHLSAKTIGILSTLLPFYGALFGYLIHDETISLRTVIGGLIILACIVLETVRSVSGEKLSSSE